MNQYPPQRGFSLVEILITIGLGAFILAGILKILANTRDTHRLEVGIAEVQDNGRYLIDRLSEAIRYRGYFGCLPPVQVETWNSSPLDWGSVVRLEPIATNAPSPNSNAAALRGFTVTPQGNWQPDPSHSAIDYHTADLAQIRDSEHPPRPGSDVLSIQYASANSVDVSKPMSNQSSPVVIANNSLNLNQGDLVLVSNCLYGDVFAISNEPADTGPIALKHQTPYNQNSKLFYPYTKNAKVRRFIAETFFVADSGRTAVDGNAIYSLYRAYPSTSPTANDLTYEELVEGVEFMKILYGQRVSKNNIHYVSAPDNAKANSAFWLSVESIQLALLLRATTPTLSADNTTVYRLLGENIGPGETLHYQADRSYRQVFKTTVYLRNRS
ncbi:MAG: PilW family protein [Gammaproteobacteria bacterium]